MFKMMKFVLRLDEMKLLPMRKIKPRRNIYPSGHRPFSRSIGISENSISPTNIVLVLTKDSQGSLKKA